VHAIFTGAWDDPVKERAADTAIIDQGATCLGSKSTRQQRKLSRRNAAFMAPAQSRLKRIAPKATLCSSVWVWDRYFIPELKKIEAGNWTPDPYGAFPALPVAVPTSHAVTASFQRTL